jgi:hypothetical protein
MTLTAPLLGLAIRSAGVFALYNAGSAAVILSLVALVILLRDGVRLGGARSGTR